MIIYADVLLIENFIVNFFLLTLTANTLRVKRNILNTSGASLLGALYTFTILIPSLKIFTSIFFKILMVFLFTAITFKRVDFKFLFKSSIVYIGYSMLLSGMCFFMGISNINFIEEGKGLTEFSYKYILLSMMILYIVCERIIYFIRDRSVIDKLIYPIEICINNQYKKINAFLDTGNELREPATNLPVIIVEKDLFYDLSIPDKNKFYIPYKVVNGSKGRLEGFKPESIKIYFDKDRIQFKEAIVCLCDEKLSDGKEYKALLSRGII